MKAPLNRSFALVGMALVCATGITAPVFPGSAQTLSMVVGKVPNLADIPSLPPPSKPQSTPFNLIISIISMREMTDIEKCLAESPVPFENDFHPYTRLVYTVPPVRYDQEPVYKPPW